MVGLTWKMKNNYVDLSIMLRSKKHGAIPAGDYLSQADLPEGDIEFRCETVSEVVQQKIFPLEKALKLYDVSFKQYMGYLMLHNKPKIIVDTHIITVFFTTMLGLIDIPDKILDSKTEKVIAD